MFELDTREIERELKKLARRFPEITDEALEETVKEMMQDGANAAPEKSGKLKASKKIEKNAPNNYAFGFKTKYASIVHEHEGEGQGFFRNTLKANLNKYYKRIADRVKEKLGR